MKRTNYLLLMLTVVAILPVQAQKMGKQTLAQLKESSAGSRIIDYMEAINGGEPVSNEWVKSVYAPKLVESVGAKKLSAMMQETQEVEGKLHLYGAKRTSTFRYKLVVFGKKSGEWLEMVFIFEENEPHRILGITLDSTDAEPEATKPMYPVH